MSSCRAVRAIVTAAMMFVAATAFASDDAATIAPTQAADHVRLWFDQLAHNDPEVRENAKLKLMGLRRAQLGILRSVVDQSRPITPA